MAVSQRLLLISTTSVIFIVVVFAVSTTLRADTSELHPLSRAKLPIQLDPTAESSTIPLSMSEKDGYIGEKQDTLPQNKTPNQNSILAPASSTIQSSASAATSSAIPILALLYSGASGPKRCRGTLITSLNLPQPASQHRQGACYDLPSNARCGLFISDRQDHCQADLFNSLGCLNTSQTYVNTVVFMPEIRPVGALWRSMRVRCGVQAPEGVLLDPGVLQNLGIEANG